jgi:hypothetical protein
MLINNPLKVTLQSVQTGYRTAPIGMPRALSNELPAKHSIQTVKIMRL